MELGELVSFYRRRAGLTIDELAEKSGVPKSTINKIIGGTTKAPTLENVRSIAKALGVRLSDFDGEPELADMFSATEQELIKKYRLLDPYGKEAVDGVLDVESRRCEATQKENLEQTFAILQEGWDQSEAAEEIAPGATEMLVYINPAAAGTPLYAESDFERMTFPSDKVPRGADFGIKISGQSMEPTVKDGSIVWVRKRLEMPNGTVGIFMLNDSAACKRFFKEADGSVRLESDNPAFADVTVAEFDTLVTVGEVVGMVINMEEPEK